MKTREKKKKKKRLEEDMGTVSLLKMKGKWQSSRRNK